MKCRKYFKIFLEFILTIVMTLIDSMLQSIQLNKELRVTGHYFAGLMPDQRVILDTYLGA